MPAELPTVLLKAGVYKMPGIDPTAEQPVRELPNKLRRGASLRLPADLHPLQLRILPHLRRMRAMQCLAGHFRAV